MADLATARVLENIFFTLKNYVEKNIFYCLFFWWIKWHISLFVINKKLCYIDLQSKNAQTEEFHIKKKNKSRFYTKLCEKKLYLHQQTQQRCSALKLTAVTTLGTHSHYQPPFQSCQATGRIHVSLISRAPWKIWQESDSIWLLPPPQLRARPRIHSNSEDEEKQGQKWSQQKLDLISVQEAKHSGVIVVQVSGGLVNFSCHSFQAHSSCRWLQEFLIEYREVGGNVCNRLFRVVFSAVHVRLQLL